MSELSTSKKMRMGFRGLSVVSVHGLLPVVLVLTYIGFGVFESQVRSTGNLINIFKQSSYLIMLATGQMVVLLTRGFDLSVGSIISMISVASSLVMVGVLKAHPEALAMAFFSAWLVGIGIGVAVGAVNGFCVAFLRINPFVTTLAMMGIAMGFASTISGGFPVEDVPEKFMDIFSHASWLGVPVPLAICGIVLAAAYFLLNYTIFGRSVYLLGSNERAAHVAGLSVQMHILGAYVLCSTITAIVALLLTARTGSGEPMLGGGMMLASIMAAVIGGVSLRGGEGKILHCVVGALFVTVLANGMNLNRVDSYIQMMILGIVLIAAVFVDGLRPQIR